MSSKNIPQDQAAPRTILQIDLLNQLQISEAQNQKLQAELDSLKERFNYILQATQDAVWDWNLVQNVGWYNDGLKILFGHDPATVGDAVKFWYDTIHPDDRERVVNGVHAVIDNGGKHWHDQYRFRRTDGTYAWVFDRGYAIHDSDGKPVRMVGSMQDITGEVEAREALRESEEKFRGIFDKVAVGISISSPEGKFLSVNNAYPAIFGYSKEEFMQKKIMDLSHPEEIEGDHKIINDLLSGRTQVAAREKRYVHKNGRIVWGRVFGTVIYDTTGEPKYIVGVLEDITEQRQILQTLQENEERMRLVLDSGNIGTWDFDPRTGKLLWDDRCKAMFGMSPDDHADYEIFLQRIHPDDRQHADQANQSAINGAGNGEYDIEYRTMGLRDQKIRWIRAKGRSYKNENGVTVRYAGTVIDITAEKLQEQRLSEEEQRFRLLATSIPQIVWTTDDQGIVDYMSDKWVDYTGHVPTYEKFSFRELMHPEDLQRIIPEWTECIHAGTTFHNEYRLRNVNTNEYRWFSCTTAPLKDHTGKVIRWIGSATDIHDQKMVEMSLEIKVAERTRELKDLNDKLAKSNNDLEQYAYVTSHDLKEPLRKIQIYHDMITTKYQAELKPQVAEFLKKIQSASGRMSGLIEDLLKYSRLSSRVASLEPVDLNIIVQSIQEEFDHALKEKNITVEGGQLPVLKAIPLEMYQLFSNLFSNAIKFSKPNTDNRISITSSLLSQEEKESHPSLTTDGTHYKIIFQDEGIGFLPEFREQIFTMFQRLNNRQDYEGHGIGLTLCRKIVDKHHGVMLANGEENKGAWFTIILPESVTE